MKIFKIIYFFLLVMINFSTYSSQIENLERSMVFVTCVDKEFFPWLNYLLSDIYKFNGKEVKEISIYDLGLTSEQKKELEKKPFVKVCELEKRHPDILKKFKIRSMGRVARGWYAWKPVAIKQACEKHSAFLYIDSGVRILQDMKFVFQEIQKNGCFFVADCNNRLFIPSVTKRIFYKFSLDKEENKHLLDKISIWAAIQGISHKIYDSYVMPLYELTADLKNFEDDGSAPLGFGWGRHDQSISSILVHKLNFKLFRWEGVFSPKNLKLNPHAKEYKIYE
jgi:hypothetical protein